MTEKNVAFCAHFGVNHFIFGKDSETFEKGFVDETLLEPRPCILNQAVEDDEGADLSVGTAVFAGFCQWTMVFRGQEYKQLLPNSSGTLRGTGFLYPDDLDEIYQSAEIILLVLLAG